MSCKKCGNQIENDRFSHVRKYCNSCKVKTKKTYKKRPRKANSVDKTVFLLRQNGQASVEEIIQFASIGRMSVIAVVGLARKKGHVIKKKRRGMYVLQESV